MRRSNCPFLLLSTFIILFTITIVILVRKRLDPLRIYTENFCHRQNKLGEICNESTVWLTLDEILVGPLAQNDPRILRYIYDHNFIEEPSKLPYNLTSLEDPSKGQSTIIKNALRGMKNGFFVECGALDGEARSNTLMLERDYGWTGLLIEGDPKNYEKLLTKNRKSWTSFSCLAIKDVPHQVMYQQQYNLGKISNEPISVDSAQIPPGHVRVQCFPLFSLLSALNVTRVDYFSLDAEGSELDILQTIPFDTIYIKTISVEYIHVPGGREAVRKFLKSKQFSILGEVKDPHGLANDLVFINDRAI